MTALPRNLAVVGEDLARATLRDARRSARRRRAATYLVVVGLLVLTATAAVANGWLFDETPTLRAVPALGTKDPRVTPPPSEAIAAARGLARSEAKHRAATRGVDNSPPVGQITRGAARTLLTGLGSQRRVLSFFGTTRAGVCLVLSGFPPQCIPTFAAGQHLSWFLTSPDNEPTLIWGIAREDVVAVDAITGDGKTRAQLDNGAFFLELIDGPPERLVAHLLDGGTETEKISPCSLATPYCAP